MRLYKPLAVTFWATQNTIAVAFFGWKGIMVFFASFMATSLFYLWGYESGFEEGSQ